MGGEQGYSLIELLVTMVILVIVIGSLTTVFISGSSAEASLDYEVRLVSGAGLGDHLVAGGDAKLLLGQSLEARLRVDEGVFAGQASQLRTQLAKGELPRRRRALIEVDGAENRFENLAKQPKSRARLLLDLTTAKKEQLAQAKAASPPAKRLGADERGPHRGERAFAGVRVILVQVLGHDPTDDRIAKVLEALVRAEGVARVFVEIGPMDECLLQERRVGKVIAERLLGAFDDVFHRHRG
jgi:prepilin-type N-terminal cleavage/methylation domain-containing protein